MPTKSYKKLVPEKDRGTHTPMGTWVLTLSSKTFIINILTLIVCIYSILAILWKVIKIGLEMYNLGKLGLN
jgi:hypothetical protein